MIIFIRISYHEISICKYTIVSVGSHITARPAWSVYILYSTTINAQALTLLNFDQLFAV